MLNGANELERLAADLAAAPVKVQASGARALTKAARDIEANAKALAPVDTGFLRSSISSTIGGSGGKLQAEIGPTANYGQYVENGTARQRSQPYLRPATDAVLPAFEQALAQLGSDIL